MGDLEDKIHALTQAIDRLVIAVTPPTTPAKTIAGTTTETTATTATTEKQESGKFTTTPDAQFNMYSHFAKMGISNIQGLYELSPLTQKGSPGMIDIYQEKYTEPRRKLQSLIEDASESGVQIPKEKLQAIQQQIVKEQVQPLQEMQKDVRITTSAMPAVEESLQKLFTKATEYLELYIQFWNMQLKK